MTDKTKEFLQKLKDSGHWNDDYDYSKVEYVNSKTKVVVIDKRFGTEHALTPNAMLSSGTGCEGTNLLYGYKTFEEAKKFVQRLKLTGHKDWKEYCISGNKPHDIPTAISKVYEKSGWVSYSDFFGESLKFVRGSFKPFEEARAIAQSLDIKTAKDWNDYCQSGNKPKDIPTSPRSKYKDAGWISWGDWLGTGSVANYNKVYRSFEEAREFVRALKLKSGAEWGAYCKSEKKPEDIPTNANSTYRKSGWVSMGDWLGTGRVANGNKVYRSFEEARDFARGLKLNSATEWRRYRKTGDISEDIPVNPNATYKSHGWISWGDWLGSRNVAPGSIEYLPFEDAREFVRGLNLKNGTEWKQYSKTSNFPSNLPKTPHYKYKDQWISLGDWLGTGKVADHLREYRSFEDARAFVRNLKLKTRKEYLEYCRSGEKPDDIPTSPHKTYAGKGWAGIGDWLGTGSVANYNKVYRSFEEAREFVRALDLKTGKEWKAYCNSGSKPNDIPNNPRGVYADQGWSGNADWLGAKHRRGNWLSFHEARKIVHQLELKSATEWRDYCNSELKEENIPTSPNTQYKDLGWISWGDWLGTGRVADQDRVFRPFDEARTFVRLLEISSKTHWKKYCNSGEKPEDIPSNPFGHYKSSGWVSWGDWLGTGTVAPFLKEYTPFEEAREFVRALKLKSGADWKAYCNSGKKPDTLPNDPYGVYKNSGWISWGDWLGTGNVATHLRDYSPFEEAREFVRALKLKSIADWKAYCNSGRKPKDIPNTPDGSYKDEGWISWGDWLGTGTVATVDREYMPFETARKFTHKLDLKSTIDWKVYCDSGKKPDTLPNDPYGVYKNSGWVSWGDWLGYIGDGSHSWSKHYALQFVKSLETELTDLDAVELITIINSNNLAKKLKELGSLSDLVSTQAGSEERKQVIQQIIETLQDAEEGSIDEAEQITEEELSSNEFAEELLEADVIEITEQEEETQLKPFDPVGELKMYDNPLVIASLDDENVEFLMKNQLKKLWNRVLNDEVDVEAFRKAKGGENFTIIKNWFFEEYKEVTGIVTPDDYIFKYTPNLMQRLVSYRLIREKHYGNWSGTGAGKTLAAIFSGRLAGAKNTVIICNNATVAGWVESIHEYFKNNKVYTKKFLDDTPTNLYTEVDKYDVRLEPDQNNYLVLNYETFQLEDGEYIVSELLKHNTIDYVILDEVQNVKQRHLESESTRRSVVNKLIIHAREKNDDLLVMAMSATPVINNLTEPKKLIELLSGEKHDDLETSDNVINGVEMYKALTRYGLRYRPNYNIAVNEEIIETDGTELSEQIRSVPKGAVVEFEKILIETKLNSIKDKLKKGTLVYTHYVTELSHVIGDYIKNLGFSVGYYTGEDKMGLKGFKDGTIDVLVGSAPIGTGVDGIQYVCNTLIPIVLPWTSAEYAQLVGRINRQGSKFDKVNIYIPQVVIPLDEGVWSWDKRRHNIIKFKASLADLAVDGRVPKSLLPPKGKLIEQAKQELTDWINRLENNETITFEREELMIPLNPKQIEYKRNQLGDFSELNKSWSIGRSENTHKRLQEDPSEWHYYHTLYSEKRKTWKEIPYMEIAKNIKQRPDWIVADMGCGENLLAKEIGNKVHAFDHFAIEDSVTACDISNVPMDDESVNVVVFSLALMGSNYLDYLKEGYRILKPYGHIFISEPAAKWEGKEEKLREQLEEIGFKVFEATRNTERFIYIDGVKQ